MDNSMKVLETQMIDKYQLWSKMCAMLDLFLVV
jgi:hypothetical protein